MRNAYDALQYIRLTLNSTTKIKSCVRRQASPCFGIPISSPSCNEKRVTSRPMSKKKFTYECVLVKLTILRALPAAGCVMNASVTLFRGTLIGP
jgi:hypothetical protein